MPKTGTRESTSRFALSMAYVSTAGSPFRLCFRLEEPPVNGQTSNRFNASGKWTVQYFLQARDDPSLLVPTGEAWTPRGQTATLLLAAEEGVDIVDAAMAPLSGMTSQVNLNSLVEALRFTPREISSRLSSVIIAPFPTR